MSLAAFTFTDRVRPIVEVGLGDTRIPIGSAKWDSARWDDPGAVWAGVDPTWVDITCDTARARCQYGRDHSTDRYVAGAATIVVDNASGWADPNASSDPFALTMRPGRSIRMGVEHVGYGTRWLFRGFVDAVIPTYDPSYADAVQLDCIDALGEVNRTKLVPLDVAAYGGETVTARVARILDLAGWDPTKRDLSPTGTTLIADTLGGQVADLLSRAADSGAGALFGDLDANIVYRNRDWQTYEPGAPLDGTIGNVDPGTGGYWTATTPRVDGYLAPQIATGGSSSLTDPRGRAWTVDQADAIVGGIREIPPQWVEPTGDVCPVAWQRPFARSDMATRVIMGRDAATAVQVDDLAGQVLYGVEPFEQTDLLTESDETLLMMANRILRTRSATTAPRVRAVTLHAATADNVADLMSTVDVWKPSRYRCRLAYPRGTVFDAEHFATGAVHEMTPGEWVLNLSLDLAAPWLATGGRWDQSSWDQALWAMATELGVLA